MKVFAYEWPDILREILREGVMKLQPVDTREKEDTDRCRELILRKMRENKDLEKQVGISMKNIDKLGNVPHFASSNANNLHHNSLVDAKLLRRTPARPVPHRQGGFELEKERKNSLGTRFYPQMVAPLHCNWKKRVKFKRTARSAWARAWWICYSTRRKTK